MKKVPIRNMCITAICIALCSVLPIAFHAVGLGSILSPMHIPVLLCGLACGGLFGGVCGLVGPLLSFLITGMPGAMMLPRMIPELIAYGAVAGICVKHIRTGASVADVYIALIAAMLAGRVAGGIATVIVYALTTGVYSFQLWLASYFVEAIPGIIIHLFLIPGMYFTLLEAKLISRRYAKVS